MSIVEQIKDIVESERFAQAREQSASMQALYLEMESQGYTDKKGYTLAPSESVTQMLPLQAAPSFF